ncbi:hypothetical protein TIFTF001_034178 [Ficus carica]|uniref:Uncharacterized protein n=1 Tax=Ficus carica TaxID=3494 RepID=A0AA88DZT9_FICCA|nr:hypothetical protein TIFTF001_034178 [Ficus carica]
MSSSLELEINNTSIISQTVLDNNQRKEEADQEEQEVKEDPDQETFSYVTQQMHSTAVTMSLKTAAELEVFDIIVKAGPDAKLSPAEIVAQLPTNNPKALVMLKRLLRLLACYSFLRCSVVTSSEVNSVSNNFILPYGVVVTRQSLHGKLDILEFYKSFGNLKQLVDVGGGLGVALNLITSKYPFDMPHVIFVVMIKC